MNARASIILLLLAITLIPIVDAAPRINATETIATIATPHFANVSSYFINGTNESYGPPSFKDWGVEGVNVYVDIMGPIAYLLIFFIPFGMIWMAHGDTRLLSILGLITGAFVLAYLPSTWAAAAGIVIVAAIVSLIWRLMRP